MVKCDGISLSLALSLSLSLSLSLCLSLSLSWQIQGAWRGYYVRKYVFNYYAQKSYLEGLKRKNEIVR